MKIKNVYLSVIVSVLFLFAIYSNQSTAYAEGEESRITKGVFVDEVDVSGMTVMEANQAVERLAETLRGKGIAIMVADEVIMTTLGDLGYTYKPTDCIMDAIDLGTSGNLIKRYKDMKDIEQGNVVYPLEFTIDEKALETFIQTKVSIHNILPINASVTRKNGSFVYTDHVIGSKVDETQTIDKLKDIIFNNWNRTDIVMDAVMVVDHPMYTKDMVSKTKSLLGSFTTEYATSAEGRAANLANGARLINNTVLYPGEIFSAYEYLTPFTPENGYYQAGAYSQGRVVDSIGGGACQVTTTLYNAILLAELEIVERQAHSMTISYVDLSRDAAIAGTYKDLKFKNNQSSPILIEAITKGRKITFNLWGHETRDTDSRKVEYKTVIINETAPPDDVVTKDPNQPTTYRKVTQSAHTGYKTELYKVVYENGVEVSRELVNKSFYNAAPRYVTIGTKVVEEKAKEEKVVTSTPPVVDDVEAVENEANEETPKNRQSAPKVNRNNTIGQSQLDALTGDEVTEE